jgi:hypothetical protein
VSAPPAPRQQRTLRTAEALRPWGLAGASLVIAFVAAGALLALYKGHDFSNLAAHAAVGAVIVLAVVRTYRRKLEADAEGLRVRSGLPWPLRSGADWQARWPEIRGARWAEALHGAELELDTVAGPRRLMALNWQADAAEARSCRRALRLLLRGRAQSFDATLLPLVRALREHGVDVPPEIRAEDAEERRFDLTSNTATKVALIVAAFAAGFWLLDANLSSQVYGRHAPWGAFAAACAVIAAAVALAQSRCGVPPAVNALVAAVVALAVGLALHSALLRLNQLADRDGPRTVEFTLAPDGTLVSNAAGVADLPAGYFGDASFWAEQKPGSVHRFGYHRGLGFETLDVAEYRARMKEFQSRGPGRDVRRP